MLFSGDCQNGEGKRGSEKGKEKTAQMKGTKKRKMEKKGARVEHEAKEPREGKAPEAMGSGSFPITHTRSLCVSARTLSE